MPGRSSTVHRPRARQAPAAVVVLALLVLAVSACARGEALSSDDDARTAPTTAPPSPSSSPSSTSSSTSTSTTTTSSTTTTTTTSTVPPPPPISLGDIRLQEGDEGEAVRRLEQQLLAAGFWLDRADDGVFDESTLHAVVALQKTHGLERTGVLDLAALVALSQGGRPDSRSLYGPVIEVDLTRQVLLVVQDGTVREVFDVSTGRRAGWTPEGEYKVNREVDGIRNAPLGRLYRPKYFVRGVAVHGYSKVPPEPQSHGCVRVTNAVMDHIWDTNLMPKGTAVWVYS
jgi:peptidoglycan hydrolase-like protein with peptidoglycan-binding domain